MKTIIKSIIGIAACLSFGLNGMQQAQQLQPAQAVRTKNLAHLIPAVMTCPDKPKSILEGMIEDQRWCEHYYKNYKYHEQFYEPNRAMLAARGGSAVRPSDIIAYAIRIHNQQGRTLLRVSAEAVGQEVFERVVIPYMNDGFSYSNEVHAYLVANGAVWFDIAQKYVDHLTSLGLTNRHYDLLRHLYKQYEYNVTQYNAHPSLILTDEQKQCFNSLPRTVRHNLIRNYKLPLDVMAHYHSKTCGLIASLAVVGAGLVWAASTLAQETINQL